MSAVLIDEFTAEAKPEHGEPTALRLVGGPAIGDELLLHEHGSTTTDAGPKPNVVWRELSRTAVEPNPVPVQREEGAVQPGSHPATRSLGSVSMGGRPDIRL